MRRRAKTEAERFWLKVFKTEGCWLWTAAVTKGHGRHQGGYGRFRVDGTHALAHRWAYEDQVGAIPAGLDLDHLCRNRRCVNPAHLEPVTRSENMQRAFSTKSIRTIESDARRVIELYDERCRLSTALARAEHPTGRMADEVLAKGAEIDAACESMRVRYVPDAQKVAVGLWAVFVIPADYAEDDAAELIRVLDLFDEYEARHRAQTSEQMDAA